MCNPGAKACAYGECEVAHTNNPTVKKAVTNELNVFVCFALAGFTVT